MSFKIIFVLASIFYLPISSNKNQVQLYEPKKMIETPEFTAPQKTADLQMQNMNSRIKFVHKVWDKTIIKSNN